jgi:ribosome-associated translation inhibitor RaiA
MKILINTDRTIKGDENHQAYFTELIATELDRFESYISKIEVHLSDQNGNKEGRDDIHCLIEARIEGKQPIAVSKQANSTKLAISGAIEKLKAALETIVGRMQNHTN